MRSALVVISPPRFNDPSGMVQADEPVLIQTFISQPADEAFGISVFNRFDLPPELAHR